MKKLVINVVNYFSTLISSNVSMLIRFPIWLTFESIIFWFKFVTRTFLRVYDSTGIEIMIGNLLSPFRRDRSFAGYLVGITLRLVWSAVSLIVLSITALVLIILMILYYGIWMWLWKYKPELILPYLVICFGLYFFHLSREKYWKFIKAGNLTSSLRHEVWKRMDFNPKEVESVYRKNQEEFILFLRKRKLNEQDFISTRDWILRREYRKIRWKYWRDEFFYRKQGVNVGWVAGFIPELKKYSVDLTKEAARGDLPHAYGREIEIEKILTVLGRTKRNNILLVGDAGVGKTSLIYSLAWLILGNTKDISLPTINFLIHPIRGRRVIELNTGGMVGATSYRGSLEARFAKVIRELNAGQTILFINQIENMIQAGLIGYLTPIVRSTRFPIIATTTTKVYNEYILKLPEFASEFEILRISPPGIVEAIRILEGVADEIEMSKRIFYTYPALHACVELSERYIHDSVLPDKAIKVMAKASEKIAHRKISIAEIENAVSVISGVPVGDLSREEADKLLNIEQLLKERIVGQGEAIRTIAKALRRARTGVSSQNRPIASLLFLGSTGVGKTLTAKTLAQVYFTPQQSISVSEAQMAKLIENSFIRFDMSEFSEPGSVGIFIGRLTEAIRQQPFTLLLLDEFEKAEQPIHNLFLQVLEDGRLTNADGNTADFRNAIIIATSNAVTKISENEVNVDQYIRQKLEERFRPELINRFDGLVLFNPLRGVEIAQIVIIELKQLAKRLKNDQEITITWTDQLVNELAKIGYDPDFGARPLRRIIQDRIEDDIAQKILRKELQFGDTYQLTSNILS